MRTVSVRLDDLRTMILNLGFVGENEHTRVLIDAKKMYDQYPTASASLTVSPPHGAAYPAVIERDGDLISWDVTDSDLINEGAGELQLAFTVNEVVAKSYIGRFRVNRSIIPTGEIPEPLDDFLTRAGAALTAIPETIDEALGEVTAEAETLAAGSDATALYNNALKQFTFGIPRGADGQAGAPGRDGTDGRDGQDGAPGADGFSPSASVTKSGNTATITITDKTGTTTAQISDGESGASVIDDNAGVGDTDKVWSANKTATENGNLLSALNALPKNIEYKFSNGDILLGFGYSDTYDAVIVMNNGRANGLFDFSKFCTKTKGTSLENLDTEDLETVWSSGTDMHGPFQVIATSNADGYHTSTTDTGFVGGNHTLDQMGSDFKTAESVYVHFYADGVPVETGFGYAENFEIKWANNIQGYNTCKQGGGGRAVLREYHDMIFNGVVFKERITLKALEEIKLSLWYGLQCVSIGTTYNKIAFVDASNRGTFSSSDNSITSGNATTSGFIGYGDEHRIEMNVDTGIDLGKRTLYSGTSGAFVSATKGYFGIINQSTTIAAGAMYYLDGSYRFLPQIVESKGCTGLVLDQNSLSFDSVDETKTLVATPTPEDTTDTVTWSTSNANIATVSNGVVTIHGIGSATITATCGNRTASATISQTSIKPKGGTKIVGNAVPDSESNVVQITNASGQKTVGQTYVADDTDVHMRYGQGYDVQMIRVPYGATKAKIATTDSTAVSISYTYLCDTNDMVTTPSGEFPKFLSRTTFVNTSVGITVEYGQCVVFRPTDSQATTLDYVYFT